MASPLLISVALACGTTGAAWLWGLFVAIGLNRLPETGPTDHRDIQTW